MVDRKARDQMAQAIRSYMDERVRAFEFDKLITQTATGTQDNTVQRIRQELWSHYDDLVDHKIHASKQQWDYFNRLLLLLGSDAEFDVVRRAWNWHVTQAVAAACLVCFAYLATRTTLRDYMVYWAGPFGVVSIALIWVRLRRQRKAFPLRKIALVPFQSINELLYVRRRVSGFVKTKYPKALAQRRIRGRIAEKLAWIPGGFLLLIVSPIVLFFLALPEGELEARVNLPKTEKAGDALSSRA